MLGRETGAGGGGRPTLGRRRADAVGPGLGRTTRHPSARGGPRKNGRGDPRLPPSGLRKFPSDRSDAPAGERVGSRAASGGPALGARQGERGGRSGRGGRRARPPGGARGGGRTPGAGGSGLRDGRARRAPPGRGVAGRPTAAGAPSSSRRRPARATAPSPRPGPARRPGPRVGAARAPRRETRVGAAAGGRGTAPSGPVDGRGGRRARGSAPRGASPARPLEGGGRTGRPPRALASARRRRSLSRQARARARPSDVPFSRSLARSLLLAAGAAPPDAAVPLGRAPAGRLRSPDPPSWPTTSVGGRRAARPRGSLSLALSLSLGRGGAGRGRSLGEEEAAAPRRGPGPPPPPPPPRTPRPADPRALVADGRPRAVAPRGRAAARADVAGRARRALPPVMILPQVHLRKPCYDFYFL